MSEIVVYIYTVARAEGQLEKSKPWEVTCKQMQKDGRFGNKPDSAFKDLAACEEHLENYI